MDNKKTSNLTSQDIENRISKLKAETRTKAPKSGRFVGIASGFRMGTDFLSGVILGGAIGRLLDIVCDIEPFGLVTFILIGAVAGMLNVYRYAKEREAEIKKNNDVINN